MRQEHELGSELILSVFSFSLTVMRRSSQWSLRRRSWSTPDSPSTSTRRSRTTTSSPSRTRRSPVCVGRRTVGEHSINVHLRSVLFRGVEVLSSNFKFSPGHTRVNILDKEEVKREGFLCEKKPASQTALLTLLTLDCLRFMVLLKWKTRSFLCLPVTQNLLNTWLAHAASPPLPFSQRQTVFSAWFSLHVQFSFFCTVLHFSLVS